VAWLRFEAHGGEQAEVDLAMWPGAPRRLLAYSGFHGAPITWV
jgi:hypothetical protein